jgi:hypothetical protein
VELTQAQKREFAQERARLETERATNLAHRLEQFTTAELWEELHRRMNDENRQWWRNRGIPDEWQNYLELGYMVSKQLADGITTPAYTIPYLRPGYTAVTMQYRLVNPPDPKDKYRFEAGLPAAYYMVTPTQEIGARVVICEGAIKGIVTAVYGGLAEDVSVISVPGKTSWAGVVEAVKNCEKVWIILDPDGEREAMKLAGEIGKQSRVVRVPGKIDDMLLDGSLGKDALKNTFRTAKRL